jgi:hypothetical protein
MRPAPEVTVGFFGVLRNAVGAALQWRVLLLWILASWLPTALLALPIWRSLARQLDHSLHSAEWARHANLVMIHDLVGQTLKFGGAMLAGSGIAAAVLLLALMPLLNGMLVTASRADRPLGFGALLQGALREYGRMLRLMAWALIPLGIAAGLGVLCLYGVHKYARGAILETEVLTLTRAAHALTAVLCGVALATVDAGRARLAYNPQRRSAIKAWWRGLQLTMAQPLRALGLFFCITLIAALAAGVLALLRVELSSASLPGFLAGLMTVQIIVAVTGWMHFARLLAMLAVTKGVRNAPSRSPGIISAG